MKKIDRLSVFFNNSQQKRLVGTLALYKNRLAAFSYSDQWLSDGWGRLLVDRMLLRNGILPETLSVLDRLAIVGSSGMGALTYEPEACIADSPVLPSDYDEISAECERILNAKLSENDKQNLDAIFAAGASSGGARPKVFAKIDGEEWIVKFPSSIDSKEIGRQEYEYNQCAKKCGLTVNDFALLPSKKCAGYFATKRFDRNYLGSDSNSIGGEHATTISGEGKNPTIENILEVAAKNGIKKSKARKIAESVKAIVKEQLGEWLS